MDIKIQDWYVYLLYSKKVKKHYIGYTNDLEGRLEKHNSGKGAKLTRMADDWEMIRFVTFKTKSEALSYEQKVKIYPKLRAEFYQKVKHLD